MHFTKPAYKQHGKQQQNSIEKHLIWNFVESDWWI